MSIFLENTPVEVALDAWVSAVEKAMRGRRLSERVAATSCLERVTAEPVFARISSPFYHCSAMDGYAVQFPDTFGASETTPVRLEIPGRAVYVNTGDPVPEGFNAVIKIEDTNVVEDRTPGSGIWHVEIVSPAVPWQNVRIIGEDIVARELIVPENHVVRPIDLAAVLAGGVESVLVKRKADVAVIPTGDEIVMPGVPLKTGDIIDTNSWMLSGLLLECGAQSRPFPVVPDRKELIAGALAEAVSKSDLVLVIAGSSLGTEDFTASVIRDAGQVVVHGVNIKPGKPVILGIVNGTPVIGVPGYPVSAFLAFKIFVKPIIARFFGTGVERTETLQAKLARQIPSPLGVEEFVRLKLGQVSGKVMATPVGRGAGLITSLVRADGIMRIPALSEGYPAGTEVEVELLRERRDIENTVVCVGSHDNAIDLMAHFLKKRYPRYSLSSAHVGSMGGLMAIRNGEAHIAGTHLLDEESGEYNVAFLRRILPERKLKLYNLVHRMQGLIVRKGNPKKILSVEALAGEEVIFINRQAGSGTRLLTDKVLRESAIPTAEVRGYERIEFTHMAVASAVRSGVADAGMGIYAAAVALDLDFIPVARERYDIVVPEEFAGDNKIEAVLEIMGHDEEFRSDVAKMGGYDVSDMGTVVYEQ